MPPRRPLAASRFDIVVLQREGALELWKIINKERKRFQAARSLYIQVSEEGFKDADDDQWAIALEAIRPGNVSSDDARRACRAKPAHTDAYLFASQIQHNLKHVKIEIVGKKRFLGCSTVALAPPSTYIYPGAQSSSASARRGQFVQHAGIIRSERAFIKALANLRDIEKVEIIGHMEALLKKRLAVAMTTRYGQKLRDWNYGGGLRSEDEISSGTWSATMSVCSGP